ncbi:putative melanoma antigen recognized by T-cells 1, partial [Triplophysa rosa]
VSLGANSYCLKWLCDYITKVDLHSVCCRDFIPSGILGNSSLATHVLRTPNVT